MGCIDRRMLQRCQRSSLPVQREARPVGLVDVERAEVVAQRAHARRLGVEAAGIGGDGEVPVVDQLHDLVAGPVPDGHEALHGSGPGLVERPRLRT